MSFIIVITRLRNCWIISVVIIMSWCVRFGWEVVEFWFGVKEGWGFGESEGGNWLWVWVIIRPGVS